MPFYSTGPHYCPDCPPVYRHPKNKPPVREGHRLQLTDGNYSGTGADMANCPNCGRGYAILYKVDKVERVESWDVKPEDM